MELSTLMFVMTSRRRAMLIDARRAMSKDAFPMMRRRPWKYSAIFGLLMWSYGCSESSRMTSSLD